MKPCLIWVPWDHSRIPPVWQLGEVIYLLQGLGRAKVIPRASVQSTTQRPHEKPGFNTFSGSNAMNGSNASLCHFALAFIHSFLMCQGGGSQELRSLPGLHWLFWCSSILVRTRRSLSVSLSSFLLSWTLFSLRFLSGASICCCCSHFLSQPCLFLLSHLLPALLHCPMQIWEREESQRSGLSFTLLKSETKSDLKERVAPSSRASLQIWWERPWPSSWHTATSLLVSFRFKRVCIPQKKEKLIILESSLPPLDTAGSNPPKNRALLLPAMALFPEVRALSVYRMDFFIAAYDSKKPWRTSFAWGIKKEQRT